MKRRLLSVPLCAALCLTAAVSLRCPAQAAQPASIRTGSEYAIELSSLIDPRFTYISRISSGLDINALGRAECTGSYTIYSDYDNDSTITVTLQQYKDGSWVDIKSWSEDFTGSGPKILNKGYYVSKGYRYRVITEMQIWDDSGKQVETAYCDSPVKEY